MKEISGKTFDEERALYASEDVLCRDCTFEGPRDGESAFKESSRIIAENCRFALRYPFWHDDTVIVRDSEFPETCRASFWYTKNAALEGCHLFGVKACRECDNTKITSSEIISPEFGWNCRKLALSDSSLSGEYCFFGASDLTLRNVTFKGKYSFQYVNHAEIRDSVLDTKDAFWHSKNITVYDSVINGEYLGWYSENLHLVRCKIKGTQPLCYAKGLILEDCTMTDCDLSFEYSEVHADIRGIIQSIKNPSAGMIRADGYGEILFDEHKRGAAEVLIRK